jgi:recombination protein RecT
VKFKKQAMHPWQAHFTEMGRKTVIRRLAKFLPLSIEFQTATVLDGMASTDKDQHLDNTIDGEFTIVGDDGFAGHVVDDDGVIQDPGPTDAGDKTPQSNALPMCTDEHFKTKAPGWEQAILDGSSVNDMISMIETKVTLSDDQKMEIAGWAAKA